MDAPVRFFRFFRRFPTPEEPDLRVFRTYVRKPLPSSPPGVPAYVAAMRRTVVDAGRPRWQGTPGRLEVHYLTATDTRSGTGLWIHHEVVAPTSDDAAYAHGWVALFPTDAAPSYERFGPVPATAAGDGTWARAGDAVLTATTATGRTTSISWDLAWRNDAAPLYTFPRWAWRRQVLPAAQVVPVPTARVTGVVCGRPFDGDGGVAHIYGHGNAQRWAWLHADLEGGDVLELVAATARRPAMRMLPPLALVQLRVGGRDWPRDALAAAPLLRARIGVDEFAVRGVVGTQRLRVHVTLPRDRCVHVPYTDPDGATATCTNTERADVDIDVSRLTAGGWRRTHEWQLDGTGHAEIGGRP